MIRACDLTRSTGITRKQWKYWLDLDLLPRPTVKMLGGRKGSETYFPDGTDKRVREILDLLDDGYCLTEIIPTIDLTPIGAY